MNAGHLIWVFLVVGASFFPPLLGSPEGKRIQDIIIEVSRPGLVVSESYVSQNLQVEEGGKYSANAVNRSIKNLMDTGLFSNALAFVEQSEDEVILILKVFPRYRIGEIDFNGNFKISEKKLLNAIKSKKGEILDKSSVVADVSSLQDLYYEKGFWDSKVTYEIIDDPNDASMQTLQFEIIENQPQKIRKILFSGNHHLANVKLLDEMETAPWRFWRFWSKRSKYRPRVLAEDFEAIRAMYQNQGFLDVEVEENTRDFASSGILSIRVSEGGRFQFGEIKIKPTVLFTTGELLEGTMIFKGKPYSPSLLNKEKNRIKRMYGDQGYLDAVVEVVRESKPDNNRIDLTFAIDEGKPFKVNSIRILGNEKTKSVVLLRELVLAPGDDFDLTKMETSQSRLQNTNFFEKVEISDEPTLKSYTGSPRRDLVVEVTEKTTGHVSFGMGFSTLEKVMMYAEIRQGNFDLMRWRSPDLFQGAGQKFRLRLKLGSRSNEARIAFEEPWFLNRRLAAGFELFREKSDYQSSYYDELRAGFEVYFRKRIFELVEGRLFYSFEDVLIEDIAISDETIWIRDDLSYNVNANEIKRTVSKVGLTLSRDTRKEILFPKDGSVVTFKKEFAGGVFGGDADYGRFELQGVQFFNTFDAMEQVLSISGRTGTLGKFDGEDANVPFFEKFFLGGPYNLRGWDYRAIGPNVLGEPIGGKSFTSGSLEYTFKVADPLRLAAFYDAGYLRKGDFKFSPGKGEEGWHDNWGFGLRIMVMGMPLRLDLGFPLSDPSRSGASTQFHFSGGTRF